MKDKPRDPLQDNPKTAAVYQRVMQDFIYDLCRKLRANDARVLARSVRTHDGVIVFADDSGGILFEVEIRFSDVLNKSEMDQLVSALVEKHGPGGPVTLAGDVPTAIKVAADIAKKRGQ